MQEKYEMWVWSIGLEDALKEGMATPSGIFAWRIPWTEEPGGLRSIGLQKSDMTEATKCACTEQERTLHQVRAAGQSTSHSGPRDPADQVCLKCRGGKTAFLALQQVPPIASQSRPLKFSKKKGLLSSVNSYFSFAKQLLGPYWALVETECWTMGHWVTIWPGLLTMNWVLSDAPSHKVGHVHQCSII